MSGARDKQPALPDRFLEGLRALGRSYLSRSDPIEQSGFSGGPIRWRLEREPILEAVDGDGSFIDIGCANGYLLECLGEWARERGHVLELHGLEYTAELAALARRRLGDRARIHVGNAWDWQPPMRYRYVYSLHDVVPRDMLEAYLRRLATDVVAEGGRLIIGSYGSRSRGIEAFDVAGALERAGLEVRGTATGGDPPIGRFAWTDR